MVSHANTRFTVSISDFELGETLYSGTYASVLCARLGGTLSTSSSTPTFALKVFDKKQSSRAGLVSLVIRERLVHSQLVHPHVLRMLGAFHDDQCICFVLEFCQGGTLASLVQARQGRRLAQHETKQVLEQLLDALEYVHAQKVVHCDIKPENILFLAANSDGSAVLNSLRLADFGSAVTLGNSNQALESGLSAVRSTVSCTAPEVLDNRSLTEASDMWSVGCIVYYCLSGEELFGGAQIRSVVEARNTILQAPEVLRQRVAEAVGSESDAQDLICGLVDDVPARRFTIRQVRDHSFLRDNSSCA